MSKWRKRDAAFPQPVGGTGTNPLFDRDAVVLDWLRATGAVRRREPFDLQVWALLNALRDSIDASEFQELLLSAACARTLLRAQSKDQWDALVSEVARDGFEAFEAPRTPGWTETVVVTDAMRAVPVPGASAMVRGLDGIPLDALAAACDYVASRLAGHHGRPAVDEVPLRSALSDLLIGRILRPGPRIATSAETEPHSLVLYDPAVGSGSVLLEAAQRIMTTAPADGLSAIRVIASDPEQSNVTAFRQRALLRGITVEAVVADVLAEDPDPSLRADVIVCVPPTRPSWIPRSPTGDGIWPGSPHGTPPNGRGSSTASHT